MSVDDDQAMRDYQLLAGKIDRVLNGGGCRAMRFALVIWCDCAEEPIMQISSDPNAAKVIAMMRQATKNIEDLDPLWLQETAGHA
jgi:hypothetical protein